MEYVQNVDDIKNDGIKNLRDDIDKIDMEVLKLLSQRKAVSDKIIHKKLLRSLPVLDSAREKEIVERCLSVDFGLSDSFVNKFFNLIFDESKRQYYKLERFNSVLDYIKRKPIMIAGPCVVESEEQINIIASSLSALGVKYLRGGTFKPRTSPNSFQGLGNLGVKYLSEAARAHNMFSVTEILEAEQLEENYDLIDVVQIGSRSMTSYGLLKSVGALTATDGKLVVLKRGFSATLTEFLQAAEYILQAGNPNVILCLRGIRTFEQIDSSLRFTPDLASILELKERTKLPVIFDPSHSVGRSDFVVEVSNAALQLGADGLMIETHHSPADSKVDANQAIMPQSLLNILNL